MMLYTTFNLKKKKARKEEEGKEERQIKKLTK